MTPEMLRDYVAAHQQQAAVLHRRMMDEMKAIEWCHAHGFVFSHTYARQNAIRLQQRCAYAYQQARVALGIEPPINTRA